VRFVGGLKRRGYETDRDEAEHERTNCGEIGQNLNPAPMPITSLDQSRSTE